MTGHHLKGKYSTWHQHEHEKQDIQTHKFPDEETVSKQWTDWLPSLTLIYLFYFGSERIWVACVTDTGDLLRLLWKISSMQKHLH